MRGAFAFPKTFWVVNGIELLERGAYYSFAAVSTVFMRSVFVGTGMTNVAATSLAATFGALLFLLLYAVPVVASPFTEKFGYRSSLVLVFALLVAGYTMSFLTTAPWMVVAYILLIGVGAGIFKPIPASIVTQTSTDDRRSLAFSIYYACINLGALIFPLGLGLVGTIMGWQQGDVRLFRTTFAVSAALVGLNILVSLFIFRNLRAPQKDKSFTESMRVLGEIRHYPSFLVLMAIYAGFWFMYGLVLSFLPAYMDDFHRMPGWFNELYLQTLNPLVIVVGAPLIAPLATRFKPLTLITTGVLVYAVGLVMIGFTSTSLFFASGVVIYSIGELITYPAWLAYVSRIAPAEKVSTFLGYGFIPIGVGQFLGAKVGGDLYAKFGVELGRPELYWAIMASIGFASAGAFILYNWILTRKTKDATAEPERRSRFPVGVVAALLILLLIPAVVLAGAVVPAQKVTPSTGSGDLLSTAALTSQTLPEMKGTTAAKATSAQTITLPGTATGSLNLTLTWTDAQAPTGYTATPDGYDIHVTAPNGSMVAMTPKTVTNGADGKGTATLTVEGVVGGDWKVEIVHTQAGSYQNQAGLPVPVPGGTPISPPDSTGGENWKLAGSYQTHA
ncbi:MAG: proton-dependent oligopeptide transporter, family [Thermoplasmata archaeon]|jgi:dipeptide/tripeptide permease|nr:proton-dependent oligopeptide transporter, family [Thermoplasmata archaeon]